MSHRYDDFFCSFAGTVYQSTSVDERQERGRLTNVTIATGDAFSVPATIRHNFGESRLRRFVRMWREVILKIRMKFRDYNTRDVRWPSVCFLPYGYSVLEERVTNWAFWGDTINWSCEVKECRRRLMYAFYESPRHRDEHDDYAYSV